MPSLKGLTKKAAILKTIIKYRVKELSTKLSPRI